MIRKPNKYNETQEYGNFKTLPAGGYVCKIIKIEETKSKAGMPMLKIALDISQGEYQGYFMDVFRKRKEEHPMDAKYPNGGIAYVVVENEQGECHRGFKSFTGALEKCGYSIWGDGDVLLTDTLPGKEIGLTFGREEYEWNGKTGWNTKAKFFCTVEDILTGNFNVPEDKPLAPSQVAQAEFGAFAATGPDDVPF